MKPSDIEPIIRGCFESVEAVCKDRLAMAEALKLWEDAYYETNDAKKASMFAEAIHKTGLLFGKDKP